MVPIEKQSKKAQQEHNRKARGSWNGVNPVSRTVPSKKTYRRAKEKPLSRAEWPSFCLRGRFLLRTICNIPYRLFQMLLFMPANQKNSSVDEAYGSAKDDSKQECSRNDVENHG